MKHQNKSQGGISPTGIRGLDDVLRAGLPSRCVYVVEGEPGTGKTTLSLQFLMEGVLLGEKVLYITFSETKAELNSVAESHGWDLSQIDVIDLSVIEDLLDPESQTTLFHPSEVELNFITERLLSEISRLAPSRIVFDSVSEMRLLAESPLRYRRQILALKQALAGREATVLFLDDLTHAAQDLQVQSIAHGVIALTRLHHEFGGERRRLRVLKLRGVDFIGGYHDYQIRKGGIEVYPRMVSSEHGVTRSNAGSLKSGIDELDALLDGGLDRGTSSLFIGPPGTSKSTLALKYALTSAGQGEKVAYFSFDETTTNLKCRAASLGMDLDPVMDSGMLVVKKIDPAELSPGEFAGRARELVQYHGFRTIIVDSLNGYIQAMPQEQFLILQLHELLTFLNNQGVVTILVLAQQGMVGMMHSPVDLTYLADTVVLTRFFEAGGAIRKAISIVKKRTGRHETTIRELIVDSQGVRVGGVLKDFHGVLTGTPRYFGSDQAMLKDRAE